jgi:hypothetical protein
MTDELHDQSIRDADFDARARRAGEALWVEVPPDGHLVAASAGRRRQVTRRAIGAGAAVIGIVAAVIAVSRGGDGADGVLVPATNAPATSVPALTTTAATNALDISKLDAADKWTLNFTGNPAVKASGTPYRIAAISALFVDTSKPDIMRFANVAEHEQLAATYLNSLGGVGGRPIEIVGCPTSANETWADCVAQAGADASIQAALLDVTDGPAPTALASKPTLVSYVGHGISEDRPGTGMIGVQPSQVTDIATAAHFLASKAPTGRIGVVDVDPTDVVSQASAVLGSRVDPLPVSDASANDFSAAHDDLQTKDLSSVAGFMVSADRGGCLYLIRALQQLRPGVPIVGVGCNEFDGAYYPGQTPLIGSDTVTLGAQAMQKATKAASDSRSHALVDVRGQYAGNLFTLVRVINSLGGPDRATPAAVREALLGYKGPVPGLGDVDCTAVAAVAAQATTSCVTTRHVYLFQKVSTESGLPAGTYIEKTGFPGAFIDQGVYDAIPRP